MCRQWKSGVKLVNAITAGRPVLTQGGAAVDEIKAPGTTIEDLGDVDAAMDFWADYGRRLEVAQSAARLAPAFTLATISERYRAILRQFPY